MRDALSYGEEDDQGITPPTLTPQQLRAVRRIAAQENGAWARAFFDGTAEAFSTHRGGLRRFAISPYGDARLAKEIPATTAFRCALLAFFTLLALAAISAADLVRRTRGGEDVGWWWLGPAGYVVIAFLIAAAFFGMPARLPASSHYCGEWVGLPGPSEGDASGYTMPGFVKAAPLYAGVSLFFCVMFGASITKDAANTSDPFVSVLGGAAGCFVWWALMLSYSRGWAKSKDGEPD